MLLMASPEIEPAVDTTDVALDSFGSNVSHFDPIDNFVVLLIRDYEKKAKDIYRNAQLSTTYPYLDQDSKQKIDTLISQAAWLGTASNIWVEVDWNMPAGTPPTFYVSSNSNLRRHLKERGMPGRLAPSVENLISAIKRLPDEQRLELSNRCYGRFNLIGYEGRNPRVHTGGVFICYKPVGGTRTVGSFEYWFQWAANTGGSPGQRRAHKSKYIAGHVETKPGLAPNKAALYQSVERSIIAGNPWQDTLKLIKQQKKSAKP